MIKLMKADITILFDKQTTTKNGFVPGIKIRTVLSDVGSATAKTRKGNSKNMMNINSYIRFRLLWKNSLRLTGNALGYEVVGNF
jgi:hypothetical protein